MEQVVEHLRAFYLKNPERSRDLAPPAPLSVVEVAEAQLGFLLPDLLRDLYLTLANGGFGPGIIGLSGGFADSDGKFLPALYADFSQENPDDPNQYWPERLLPLVNCGCGSFSCIDCSKPAAPVIGFDPNVYNLDEGTLWSDTFFPEKASLAEWLEDWLEYPY